MDKLEEFCTKHVKAIRWGSKIVGTGLLSWAIFLCVTALIYLTKVAIHNQIANYNFWYVLRLGLLAVLVGSAGDLVFIMGAAVVKTVKDRQQI
jgi:hypothetical protein